MEKDPSILVVEDSDAMRRFITAVLESKFPGAEVTQAESGFAALKALPARAFDLVITDINMPDINGLELLRYIKQSEHYRAIPVLIISTEAAPEDRERGLALGAAAYLTKPFTPDALALAAAPLLGLEAEP
jgi:two-component system, chemotaxis family, chemotaxis protein CheY